MINVIKLSVVKLSVVAPNNDYLIDICNKYLSLVVESYFVFDFAKCVLSKEVECIFFIEANSPNSLFEKKF